MYLERPAQLPRLTASSPQASSSAPASIADRSPPVGAAGAVTLANGRPEGVGANGLREEVVHPGGEAPLAVLGPGASRQGNDGQVTSREPLSFAKASDDLEPVHPGHVEIERPRDRTPVRSPEHHRVGAVGHDSHFVTSTLQELPDEDPRVNSLSSATSTPQARSDGEILRGG